MTQCKRILDLDLDFFLEPFNALRSSTRLDGDEFSPWTEAAVREFLEKKCLLNREAKIPGCVIERHDQAFDLLKSLRDAGMLAFPIHITHVDPHSDIGVGDPCFRYVHGEVLAMPVNDRETPKRTSGGMHEGNYFTFALACQWFSDVEFVIKSDTPFEDQFPAWAFDMESEDQLLLQLKQRDPVSLYQIPMPSNPRVIRLEPVVPCKIIVHPEFAADAGFDFLILATSPGFTPASSDNLIPVIKEYITPIAGSI